jgi:hypothetical protein
MIDDAAGGNIGATARNGFARALPLLFVARRQFGYVRSGFHATDPIHARSVGR